MCASMCMCVLFHKKVYPTCDSCTFVALLAPANTTFSENIIYFNLKYLSNKTQLANKVLRGKRIIHLKTRQIYYHL